MIDTNRLVMYIIAMNKRYYNYRRNESEMDEPVIFCCNNPDDSRHYGNIQRVFVATDRTDRAHTQIIQHVIDWLKGDGVEIDEVEAEALVNPDRIVSSCGAWDNVEFIDYLYNNTRYFEEHDGIITHDGAIFFDIGDNLAETNYLEDCE